MGPLDETKTGSIPGNDRRPDPDRPFGRSGGGKCRRPSGGCRQAEQDERTFGATGNLRKANPGTQFHQGLIDRTRISRLLNEFQGTVPEETLFLLHSPHGMEEAPLDPPHVGIQNRCRLSQRNGADRTGCRTTDSRKGHPSFKIPREPSPLDNHESRAMQVPGPLVISQPLPLFQNLFDRRRGQGSHIRKHPEEPVKKPDHGRNGRLLQHDFRDPDAVGRQVLSPGERTGAFPIPGQQCLSGGGPVHPFPQRVQIRRGIGFPCPVKKRHTRRTLHTHQPRFRQMTGGCPHPGSDSCRVMVSAHRAHLPPDLPNSCN